MPASITADFPHYNGVIKYGVPVANFFEDFESLVYSYDLDNKRKALVLIRCLTDHALFNYREIVKADQEKKEDYHLMEYVFKRLMLYKFLRGLILPIRRAVVTKECKTPESALTQARKVENQRAFLMEDEQPTVL